MRNLLFAIVLLTCSTLNGQITFYKQFSNNGYDYGEGITQMADSSYFITGSSSSFFDGPAQAFILKLDSLGNFKWSKHFGGSESDGGKRIMHIENDGLLIAGFTNSMGIGAYDFYLFKTDLNGNLLWENSFGTPSWDRVYDAALTRDSGVIMVGETLNTNDGEPDILIVRTDKSGNELWSQQIGNQGADLLSCIAAIDDSTFALGGKVYVEDSLMHKAYVCKMDENGLIWWEDTLALPGNSQINDVCLNASEIAYVGETNYLNNEISSLNYKCSMNGSQILSYIELVAEIDKLEGVSHFGSANRYAVATVIDNQFSYGGYDLLFSQYYTFMVWEQLLGSVHSVGDVFLGELISTIDFGSIAVGNFDNVGIGGSNLYVIKMMPNGNIIDGNTLGNFESLVNIQNLSTESSISLYPNPADLKMTINSSLNEKASLTILDSYGRIVHSLEFLANTTFDVSHLASGCYYLNISIAGSQIFREKLVIYH